MLARLHSHRLSQPWRGKLDVYLKSWWFWITISFRWWFSFQFIKNPGYFDLHPGNKTGSFAALSSGTNVAMPWRRSLTNLPVRTEGVISVSAKQQPSEKSLPSESASVSEIPVNWIRRLFWWRQWVPCFCLFIRQLLRMKKIRYPDLGDSVPANSTWRSISVFSFTNSTS